MSTWNDAKKDDISIDAENKEIDIYAGQDSSGSIYVTVKIKLLKEILKDYE